VSDRIRGKEKVMSSTYREASSAPVEAAAYGGLADAIGGIATVVLAIIALAGVQREIMLPIAVIVFGAALLVQGGTMLSEYASIIFPAGAAGPTSEQFGVGSLSTLFLVGVAGIVLGILALIGISPEVLTAIAVIAFGSALMLTSNAVRHLYMLQSSASRSGASRPGTELLAGEMASGSAGVQMLAGLASLVLGILAVLGINYEILTLAALIVLGATVILTGSALSGLVIGFMRSTGPGRHAMP
jgi:hypothetical protein